MSTLSSSSPSKADVLIVDDNPDNLRVLSQMLNIYGYKVRAVTEGALAITAAQASPPDLIMLDVNMPVMDGYDTCLKLKSDERTRSIPVIFLSAMGEVEDKVKAFHVGGVDYVTKPFQIEEVLARLETHLSIRRLQVQLESANQELASRLEELSKTQAAEREQRIYAETLRDTVAAINSSLDYKNVLDLILDQLARVVPYDAANIALLDENKLVRIRCARGYEKHGVQDYILSLHLPVDYYQNWHILLETRQYRVIPDVLKSAEWTVKPEMSWVRSHASAPIVNKGIVTGFINLDSATPGYFSEENAGRLQTFAMYAAIAIDKARLYEEAQRLAITDDLTGLNNRRHLLQLAEHEFERSQRYQRPLSAIMLDLDHFKNINDTYGHPIGDQALRALAHSCRHHLRSVDILGRYGGEEFLALLPETGCEAAVEAAERIRKQVESQVLSSERGPVYFTISLGVATAENYAGFSLENLIKNADDALYEAKRTGRNRVCYAR